MVGLLPPELRPPWRGLSSGVWLVLTASSLLSLASACADAARAAPRTVREPTSQASPLVQPARVGATSTQPTPAPSGQAGAAPAANRLHPAIFRLWQAGSSLAAPPAISSDGTIYVAGRQGTLDVLEPDGTHRFTITLGGAPTGGMQVDERGWLYVGLATGTLIAVTPEGQKYFSYNAPNGIAADIGFAPGIGLVFSGRNGVVEGVSRGGALTVRIRYEEAIVAGPIGLSGWYVVATSRGELVWGDRWGRKIRRQLAAPVRRIVPTPDSGVWAFVASDLVAFTARREQAFRRAGIVAMTVANTKRASERFLGAVVTSERRIEWLDVSGHAVAEASIDVGSDESLEIRLDDEGAVWLVAGGEQLWLVRPNGEHGQPYTFARGALLPPVLDGPRRRTLIATVDGTIYQLDWPEP